LHLSNWQIARIKVKVHPLFWVVSIAAAMTGQFFELLTLFAIVVMHELGHVFAALAVGWRVQSMELLPFGGVAKVDEWGTTKAKDEITVALAGPFINGVMILLGMLLYWLGVWEEEWTFFFVKANAWIACFNLLPIWPLDGGKILQALLSKWLPYYRTIYFCIVWSSILSVMLLAISIFLPYQWNLMVISLYLLIENRMAYKRAHYQFIRFLLKKEKETISLNSNKPDTYLLNQNERIGEVVKLIKKESYHCFQVLDGRQRVVASLSEEAILQAFFKKNPQRPISELLTIG
jgi:stage IV sporulation protein FB